MNFKKREQYLLFALIYLSYVIVIGYWLFIADDSVPNINHGRSEVPTTNRHNTSAVLKQYRSNNLSVDIWGKASIALYLWCHIFNATLVSEYDGFMKIGSVNISGVAFTFRSGPGFIQSTVPQNVSHLVLVLNGRTTGKIEAAKQWLNYLPRYASLKKVAVVLLGNEQCSNGWLLPYMKSHGGLVNIVFLVYDSPLIDDVEFFQWPLGVAEYRGFPNVNSTAIRTAKRKYKCNFIGTIYKNSSRQDLGHLLSSPLLRNKCYMKGRNEWTSSETQESLNTYINVLQNSDLTLSPVGKNTECYRLYEAMSFGSVPVVEDVMTAGNCDTLPPSPLKLLKRYKAPIISIKNWHEIGNLLEREEKMTYKAILRRRISVVQWYTKFKNQMKERFVKIVRKTFFDYR